VTVVVQASGFLLDGRSMDVAALRAALAGARSLVAREQGVRAGACVLETSAIARNAAALEALARELGVALEWGAPS
jgi:hypothetical protein